MKIGDIVSKSGVHYGVLTETDIDYEADSRTFFTMYSAIMHDVKRYGYLDAYTLWTHSYDRLIQEAEFTGKQYCLRAGEAIRYFCCLQSGVEFVPKLHMRGDEKWVIDWLYIGESNRLDMEFLKELREDISSVEDCFAPYKIAFSHVDFAI